MNYLKRRGHTEIIAAVLVHLANYPKKNKITDIMAGANINHEDVMRVTGALLEAKLIKVRGGGHYERRFYEITAEGVQWLAKFRKGLKMLNLDFNKTVGVILDGQQWI